MDADDNRLKLVQFLRKEQRRSEERKARLISAIQTVPVADDVLDAITFQDRVVLQHHPGYQAECSLVSLWSVLESLEQCHSDLRARLQEFDAFSSAPDFHHRRGKPRIDEIHIGVRKELLAFSAATAALVDHARRIDGHVPVPDLEVSLARHFDPLEHRFVIELRNLISHGRFPMTNWQIEYLPAKRTGFVLSTEELLELPDLKKDSREYLNRAGRQIDLGAVATSYMNKVRQHYDWYRTAVEKSLPLPVADYRRCKARALANSARMQYRLLLTEWCKRKVDPYQYLEKYLLANELEIAKSLPDYSRTKVDYIISVADEFGVCDDELRQLLYELFGVVK